MEDGVIFEDYNIKFMEKDFEDVSLETLKKCKERLEETLSKLDVV